MNTSFICIYIFVGLDRYRLKYRMMSVVLILWIIEIVFLVYSSVKPLTSTPPPHLPPQAEGDSVQPL